MSTIAVPTILVLLLIGGTIFSFGYARAVFARANSDYKKTKAGLPGMRKDVWKAAWAVVKLGFWIGLVALVLITWAIVDARKQ